MSKPDRNGSGCRGFLLGKLNPDALGLCSITLAELPNDQVTIRLSHPISGFADGASFPMDVPNQRDAAAGTYVDGLYNLVQGTVTYHVDAHGTSSIILTATKPLPAGPYTIRIGSNFVDLAGNALASPGQIAAFTISSSGGTTLPRGGSTGSEGTTPPGLPGPVVLKATAAPHKGTISSITVAFNETMDPSSVVNLSNYVLADAGTDHIFGTKDDKKLLLRSVTRSSASTITITLKRPISATHSLRLRINAQAPSGVRDASGRLLDSSPTGTPGASAVLFLGKPARAKKT